MQGTFIQTVRWGVVGVMLLGGCRMINAQTGEPAGLKKGVSPGPTGLLVGEDYRVPLNIIEAVGQYGPGDYARWIKVGGRDRYYEVHVPPGYKPGKPTPVIMALHGGVGNACITRFLSGLDKLADREGFIFIYPAGTGPNSMLKDRMLHWNYGAPFADEKRDKTDDVGYIRAVLDDAAQCFSIDAKRVFATGISNGAQMCYRLICELSARIAAIAPVSGPRPVGEFVAAPTHPVSIMAFHGKMDTFIPFDGGTIPTKAYKPYPQHPVEEVIQSWVKFDGCTGKPTEKTVNQAHCRQWEGKDGSEIVFWILDDGGHTWPGGHTSKTETKGGVGPVSPSINASELMWAFFQQHPLK